VPATGQVYNHDLMGRVTNNQQTVGDQTYALSYGYNVGDALTSETYPSGRVVSYAFDSAARLAQVSSGSTVYANQFDYSSPQGLLKSLTLGNGAVESFDYNSRLQLKSIDLAKTGTVLQHYDYKYGVFDPTSNSLDETKNNGQIARIEGTIGTQKQWQQNFTYDSIGRLSSAREFRGDNPDPSGQSYLTNYDYDLFGNRYQKQSRNGGNPFTQIWTEDSDINQLTNRIASGVSYDDAGNVLTDQKFRQLKFQYDANNRQKQSSNLDDTGAVASVYDAGGQRVATQIAGALTNVLVYDAMGKLVAEYGSSSTTNGTQYVMADHQGSTRAVMKGSGTAGELVVSRHDYLPFGEELYAGVGMRATNQSYNIADSVRQKYAGMETDGATGMAHTLWRNYDQSSGRWTAPDPYGGSMTVADPQSFNRYSYVNNDPVNQVDPSGLMLSDIGIVQTEDEQYARTLQGASDADFQRSVNADYQKGQRQPHRKTNPPIPKTIKPKMGSVPPPLPLGGPLATRPKVDVFEIGLPPPPPSSKPIPAGLVVVDEADLSNACCISGIERTYQIVDQNGRKLGGETSEEGVFLTVGEDAQVVPGSIPDFPAKPSNAATADAQGQFVDRPVLAFPGGVAPLPDNTNRVVRQTIYVEDPTTGRRYDVMLSVITFKKGQANIEGVSRGRRK